MTDHRWYTTEDVLKDLARVTGVRANDFEEDFILRGEKPPPPPRHLTEEDAEIQLRFGGMTERGDYEVVVPDLAGITEMLQMVNNLETPENEEPLTEKENLTISLKEPTIIISKPVSVLNPNVQEFVPNCRKSSDVGKIKKDCNGLNNLKKEIIKACADKNVPNINDIQDKQSSGDQNNDEEKQRMAEILKNKIIPVSKVKNIRHRTERNVAIAALMKLHSTPPDSTTPKEVSVPNSPKQTPKDESPNASGSSSPKPILLSPEYFEGTTSIHVNAEAPEAEINLNTLTESKDSKQEIDPQVQESIDKVNNWLNKPEKPKSMAPSLEPFSFKKKEASSSSSPSSIAKVSSSAINLSSSISVVKASPIAPNDSSKTVKAQPIASTPSFVPSSYANDLAKKYQERSKAKEIQGLNLWSKLEKDLKAIDEKKKRQREQQSVDENQNDTSS